MPSDDLQAVTFMEDLFHGHISLERTPDGLKPWRIPYWERDLYPPKDFLDRAESAAGVRLRFRTDAEVVALDVDTAVAGRYDCLVEGRRVASEKLEPGPATVRFTLPPGEKSVEVYLPQNSAVTVRRLAHSPGASLLPDPDRRPRWTTYGSSITQCGGADGPSETWPAIVARSCGFNLTCLGFGGHCHLEPMLARLIRDTPADVISLCLGINVYGHGSLGARTFKPAVIGLIKTIREKHPGTPIGVISPIASPPRETKPNGVGLTLEWMRAEIQDAVERLQRLGDDRLVYVNGLDVMNVEEAQVHMPDLLHPDATGYRLMAERIERLLFSHPLFAQRAGAKTA